ncbi:uncharacterized protein F4812DRAFT_458720 [Daldinia caldariorum]|uniref:uncharacterized protein n=1 Tax=Daldinia caldariorum TaxID=326644 RepID=UPI0020087D2B|nr:uncharacterized protein F4812DRAFT_458720 [Daldinia caldariorum]KAI1468287.1 hypothetical protein F4812DRAFT_458720 [Daldinia caldariorum]
MNSQTNDNINCNPEQGAQVMVNQNGRLSITIELQINRQRVPTSNRRRYPNKNLRSGSECGDPDAEGFTSAPPQTAPSPQQPIRVPVPQQPNPVEPHAPVPQQPNKAKRRGPDPLYPSQAKRQATGPRTVTSQNLAPGRAASSRDAPGYQPNLRYELKMRNARNSLLAGPTPDHRPAPADAYRRPVASHTRNNSAYERLMSRLSLSPTPSRNQEHDDGRDDGRYDDEHVGDQCRDEQHGDNEAVGEGEEANQTTSQGAQPGDAPQRERPTRTRRRGRRRRRNSGPDQQDWQGDRSSPRREANRSRSRPRSRSPDRRPRDSRDYRDRR